MPICPEYRWEKFRAIYDIVFVRILYSFGRKYSAKIKAIPVCKFGDLHSVRQSIHLFVLFCKCKKQWDNRSLYFFRLDGNYYVAWHRAVKAEFP